jgi:HAD superfamily phosphoserine phosphatase-like hydrolase
VPAALVAARAEAFARDFGSRHELDGALAQLAADRAAGLDIVLVTASPHYYVEALARRWGIATVIATGNRHAGELILPALATPNCYGPEKVARLRALLGPASGAVARAYSDHPSDLPLLELAREPVAANPTRKLAAIAAARGWPIRRWR